MSNLVVIDTALPAGNVGFLKIEGDDVWFSPDLRDTEGWWFYWSFRVCGAMGRTLRFHGVAPDGEKAKGPLLTARGPAFSKDCGVSWQWQNPATDSETDFEFTFGAEDKEVWFSLGMNYTQREWLKFTEQWKEHRTSLTVVEGFPMEALRMGCLEDPRKRVLVTARHHACEMMANYVMEGMIASVEKIAPPDVEFLFVPFVDVRGVANGDQGKNRRPHDHNRDYIQTLHREVAAVKHTALHWGRGKLAVTLDLHCPWIRHGRNEHVFQVRKEFCVEEQAQFADILERVQTSGVGYRADGDMPWGLDWNAPSAASGTQISCSRWMGRPDGGGAALAMTFEIPYATSHGAEMNVTRCRAFGADLMSALAEFL